MPQHDYYPRSIYYNSKILFANICYTKKIHNVFVWNYIFIAIITLLSSLLNIAKNNTDKQKHTAQIRFNLFVTKLFSLPIIFLKIYFFIDHLNFIIDGIKIETAEKSIQDINQGTKTDGERFSTLDFLIKVACFLRR